MLSKRLIKDIRALSQKKFRDEYKLFVAEGEKLVGDLLPTFSVKYLFSTTSNYANAEQITEAEMKQISFLSTPTTVFAVFEMPDFSVKVRNLANQLILILDEVQNPGNLGTIIRIADWFGIHHIVCSTTTADVFNPKTIQATMGALARVQLHYVNLSDFLAEYSSLHLPIYGTFLNGENIYSKKLSNIGAIVMGNEGSGISPQVARFVTDRLLIPSYPQGQPTSESLNVAVATAITCAEFRRNA